MLVGGVLEETIGRNMRISHGLFEYCESTQYLRGGLGSLQEGLSADLALDAHGFLILGITISD